MIKKAQITDIRNAIQETAREYLGTPFHHQGRRKGVGVDCIGLLSGVAHELDLFKYDNASYSRNPDGHLLMAEMEANLQEIPPSNMQVGDVLVFWMSKETKWPQHVGFVTDYGIIHTYEGVGKVVEHGLSDGWKRRICGCFKFRGID